MNLEKKFWQPMFKNQGSYYLVGRNGAAIMRPTYGETGMLVAYAYYLKLNNGEIKEGVTKLPRFPRDLERELQYIKNYEPEYEALQHAESFEWFVAHFPSQVARIMELVGIGDEEIEAIEQGIVNHNDLLHELLQERVNSGSTNTEEIAAWIDAITRAKRLVSIYAERYVHLNYEWHAKYWNQNRDSHYPS